MPYSSPPRSGPDPSALPTLGPPAGWQTSRYPELVEVADRQHGVLDRTQLREAGLRHDQVEHEIAIGRWQSLAPTVVALHNGPLTRAQLEWLGVLHAGPGAVLSHLTACESAGLRWTPEPLVHVLTPKGDLVAPLPGLRFHQTRRRYQGWVVAGSGPARLDVEHALLLTAERDHRLRRAVGLLAAAVQQGLTTAEKLQSAVVDIRKLRHGGIFSLMLGDIAGGAESFAEIDVVRLCREAGLAVPRRQRKRRDRSGRWRYLDLEWLLPDGRLLVLEVDGSFHLQTEHWWKDKKRERGVVISGRVVLRCATVELRLEPAGVIEDLIAAGVPRFVCDRPA